MTRHTDCHAGQPQQPGLAREGIGCQRRHQGIANIRSGGPVLRKHLPDGAT